MSIKRILGLDLGISSCGWAVTVYDDENAFEPYIDDFGVRLFEVPEAPKTKESNALTRRLARSARRLKRRKKARKNELKNLLLNHNLITNEAINEVEDPKKGRKQTNLIKYDENRYVNSYVLRVKGLTEKLTPTEFYAVLLHIANKRGYENLFDVEKGQDDALIDDDKKEIKNDPLNYKASIAEAREVIGYKNGKIERTIAQFAISDDKNHFIKIRNGKKQYRFLFPRQALRLELQMILDNQSNYYQNLDANVISKIIEIIFRQRNFEDATGPRLAYDEKIRVTKNKLSKLMSIDKNHKAIKAVKAELRSYYQYKPFTELVGKCTFFPEENRFVKSSIIFDFYQLAIEVSKFSSMLENQEKRMEFHKLLLEKFFHDSAFVKSAKTEIEKILTKQFDIEKSAIKSSKAYENVGKLLPFSSFLLDAFGQEQFEQIFSKLELTNDIFDNDQDGLGILLNLNVTPNRRIDAIKTWAKKYNVPVNDEIINKLYVAPSSLTTRSRLSKRAMLIVIDRFLNNGEIAGVIQDELLQDATNKLIDKMTDKEFLAPFLDPEITHNPVLHRALSESRKVVKALFKRYQFFDKINVETTRELGKSSDYRKKLNSEMLKNQIENERIITKLETYGIRPNGANILKARLWEQQNGKSLYSLRDIPFECINDSNALQVDHIIPHSKLPDDSLNNKVLVFDKENQGKSDLCVLDFLKQNNHDVKAFQKYVIKLYQTHKISNDKKENLLMTYFDESEKLSNFVARNLNDTSYIVTYFKNWLIKSIKAKFGEQGKKVVQTIKGNITSRFRRQWLWNSPWGLDKKVRDITPWHHAIDAIIISQFKSVGEIIFAEDLIKINKMINSKNTTENELKELKTEMEFKWADNSKYVRNWEVKNSWNRVQAALKGDKYVVFPLVKGLAKELELRVPVVLEIDDNSQFEEIAISEEEAKKLQEAGYQELVSKEDKGKVLWFKKKPIRMPRFIQVVFPEEYMEKIKDLNVPWFKHYPCISYQQNFKLQAKLTGSENPVNKKTAMIKDKNGNLVLNTEKYFIDGKGTIWEKTTYYGVIIDKNWQNKPKWLSYIDVVKEKTLLDLKENEILIRKYDIISFLDKKTNRRIYKWFRSKMGEKLCANNIQTSFISLLEKSKEIFSVQNYYDTISNWKDKFKKLSCSILGYLRF